MCKAFIGEEIVHRIIDLRAEHIQSGKNRRPKWLFVTEEAVRAMNEYFEHRDAADREKLRQALGMNVTVNVRQLLSSGGFRVEPGGMMFGMRITIDPALVDDCNARVE